MTTRSDFQELASELFNDTFADFRDPVSLSQVKFDYDTQLNTTIASDETQGIKIEYEAKQISGSVQVGDYMVMMERQGLTVDVRADNTLMVFNGVSVDIKSVEEDAANATYTIQCRTK